MITTRLAVSTLLLLIILLSISMSICCKNRHHDGYQTSKFSGDIVSNQPHINKGMNCSIPWRDRIAYKDCDIDCDQNPDNDCCKEQTCKAHSGACFAKPAESESWLEDTLSTTPWCYNGTSQLDCLIPAEYRIPDDLEGTLIWKDDNWKRSTPYTNTYFVDGISPMPDKPIPSDKSCLACLDSMSKPNCYKNRTEMTIATTQFCRPPHNQIKDSGIYQNPCVELLAGGRGRCDKIAGYKLPELDNPNDVKYVDVMPGNTKVVPGEYIQEWGIVDDGSTVCKPNQMIQCGKRRVAVAYPIDKKMPVGGWPVIFMFDFMTPDGYTTGWVGRMNTQMPGGINEHLMGGKNIPDETVVRGDYLTGLRTYCYFKRYLIAAGFAVIMLGEQNYDSEYYYPCRDKDPDSQCWNRGDNPDANALRSMFSQLYANNLIASQKNGNMVLNLDKLGISGYSVGAQMVSRMINSFPKMMTTVDSRKIPFPRISAALMIGGGSYHCYQFQKEGTMAENPVNYQKNCYSGSLGCCPSNLTEGNYDSGEISFADHPPVMLAQNEFDAYAAPAASRNYFDILAGVGGIVYKVAGPKINPGPGKEGAVRGRHGIMSCQISPIIAFFLRYVVNDEKNA
jgi:hypothetical protein